MEVPSYSCSQSPHAPKVCDNTVSSAQVPILTVAGNHESEPQGDFPSKMVRASYNARYPMPQDSKQIKNCAHQGYCNPNDSGLGKF